LASIDEPAISRLNFAWKRSKLPASSSPNTKMRSNSAAALASPDRCRSSTARVGGHAP
jgi:hypothetical protein